ncbi:MAG: hypothetical protein ACSLFQ_10115 [Thermoanaerobaculia bacterium]
MSKIPPYRRTYDDPRLDASYRAFVDSVAALRGLAQLTGLPQRTAARYAKRDQWVDERDERTKAKLEEETRAALVAAQDAAVASAGSIAAKLEAEGDAPQFKTLALSVMKRQQQLFDTLEATVIEIVREVLAKAKQDGKPIAVGRLLPIVKLAELTATNARKAYGIPDVSKVIGELTGANGEPLIPGAELSDTERAAGIAQILERARARRHADEKGDSSPQKEPIPN